MWKAVTLLEMKAFVVVLLEMGITRGSAIFSNNSRRRTLVLKNVLAEKIPAYSKIFPLSR